MDFKAEIIRTSQRKLVSSDNQYEVVLRTDNPQILDFGKLPGDTIFEISINLYNNTEGDNPEGKVENAGI
jgi:hypothetical protein